MNIDLISYYFHVNSDKKRFFFNKLSDYEITFDELKYLSDHIPIIPRLFNNRYSISFNTLSLIGFNNKINNKVNGIPCGVLQNTPEQEEHIKRYDGIAEVIKKILKNKVKRIALQEFMPFILKRLTNKEIDDRLFTSGIIILQENLYVAINAWESSFNNGVFAYILSDINSSIINCESFFDFWKKIDGTIGSKIIGQIVEISSLDNRYKVLNIHLDKEHAEYSIPTIIEKLIYDKSIIEIVGDFNLTHDFFSKKFKEVLENEKFKKLLNNSKITLTPNFGSLSTSYNIVDHSYTISHI